MAQEIELKLRLTAAQCPTIKRTLGELGASPPRTTHLHNTYYDTPELALRASGVALRVRKAGPVQLQTVKTAGQSQAGLSARNEWEQPYAGHFDFAAIDEPALRARLESVRSALQPIFTTDFRRTTWLVQLAGATIEVALDRGEITAGTLTEPLLELELELRDGPPAALTALHAALDAASPLAPEDASKAARGYALHAVMPSSSIDARLPTSDAGGGMDLLLWRHAEAEDGTPDAKRALTRRGQAQAARIAAWLESHRPAGLKVLASPAVRAQQTAAAFCDTFQTLPALAPGARAADILAATGWPSARGAVLVVGHQPSLGQLAALLLSGSEADWSIKKGALWWFSSRVREGEAQVVLRAVIAPDLSSV